MNPDNPDDPDSPGTPEHSTQAGGTSPPPPRVTECEDFPAYLRWLQTRRGDRVPVSALVLVSPVQQEAFERAATALDLSVIHRFSLVPAYFIVGPLEAVLAITRAPGFERLDEDVPVVLAGLQDLTSANLEFLHTSLLELTGKGVTIGLVDSGVAIDHPVLQRADIRETPAFQPNVRGNPTEIASPLPSPGNDPVGHGTAMAGLLVGSSPASDYKSKNIPYFGGIAPDARLLSATTFDESGTSPLSRVLFAVDHLVEGAADILLLPFSAVPGTRLRFPPSPSPSPSTSTSPSPSVQSAPVAGATTSAPTSPVRLPDVPPGDAVITPAGYPPLLLRYLTECAKKGRLVVLPAGNFGPEGDTIGLDASIPGLFVVGATQPGRTGGHHVAFFSGRGTSRVPSTSTPVPTVVVPGFKQVCAKPARVPYGVPGASPYFTRISGSSVSAGQFAGLLALVKQELPRLDLADFRATLARATVSTGGTQVSEGLGIVDPQELLFQLDLLHPRPQWLKSFLRRNLGYAVLVPLVLFIVAWLSHYFAV